MIHDFPIYDFDNMRRNLNDVVALSYTYSDETNSLALRINDTINRVQSLYEKDHTVKVITMLHDIERDMVELHALINSANA